MNGRCRPNPFHRYLTIAAFVFNLSFINLAKDWHYHFAFWAFVINDWHYFSQQRLQWQFSNAFAILSNN
jgi:hypothetical protein